jgi:serine/threonine protein phosphatase PrpC
MKAYFSTCIGRRDSNDDSHIIDSNNDIKIVSICDGHGSGSKSDFVSKFLEKNIPPLYLNATPPFTKEFHINNFKKLQKKILEYPEGFTNGSTCLLMLLYKQDNDIILNTVNLGDCRLVVVYEDDFKCITTDHKPDEKNERKRIKSLGGKIYVDEEGTTRICNLSVSRVFGDGDSQPYVSHEPEIFYNKMTSKVKYIVMACDGLWDVIQNDELCSLLKSYNGKNYASELVSEGLRRGSSDNISVVVIKINDFNNIF